MECMRGTTLSGGLARGVAVVVGYELQRTLQSANIDKPDSILRAEVRLECERMDGALEKSQRDLRMFTTVAGEKPSLAAAVELLSVHAIMASEIAALVKERVANSLVGVEEALDAVIGQWVGRMQKIENEYLRERATDVRDVGQRLMRHLIGVAPASYVNLPRGAVLVTRELVPSDAIALANSGVVGIVTQFGGKLGHTAIIARSLGIPAVSGIPNVSQRISSGQIILVDGDNATITVEPTRDQKEKFLVAMANAKHQADQAEGDDEGPDDEGPCQTLDGAVISLYVNVGLQADLARGLDRGLAGVGLFRTEFLYLQSEDRPDTESQRTIYAQMAAGLGDRPLVIRTFDLGGDKLPPFLSLDPHMDPSNLNLRGLRFSLVERNLFREQLAAIVQVAQTADVRILFPMVIGGSDFEEAIGVVEEVMHDCDALRRPQIGAMIETPAALFCLDEILELADFITIGTNDLTQYLLAADRELSAENDQFTAMHPAVLRAIHQVVVAAEHWDCPVCVCGEEAGEPEFAELLIGLGVHDLSLSVSRASEMRAAIGRMNRKVASELATRALACRSPQEVRELLSPTGRLMRRSERKQSASQTLGSN